MSDTGEPRFSKGWMISGIAILLALPVVFLFIVLPGDDWLGLLLFAVVIAAGIAWLRPNRRQWISLGLGALIGLAIDGLLIGGCFALLKDSFH
ncbi:MAG: hypothetical protein RL885_06200 [Planctomycetota bacterium]